MQNFGNIMKQAKKMQERMLELQEELAAKSVEATAGGGMVSVTGQREVRDPLPEDRERGRQSRRCRDAAGPDHRGGERRGPQGPGDGRRRDGEDHGGDADPRPDVRGRHERLCPAHQAAHQGVVPSSRHRGENRGAARRPHHPRLRGGCPESRREHPRREAEDPPLLHLLQPRRRRDLRHLCRCRPEPGARSASSRSPIR